jgi:hypothetical protein
MHYTLKKYAGVEVQIHVFLTTALVGVVGEIIVSELILNGKRPENLIHRRKKNII